MDSQILQVLSCIVCLLPIGFLVISGIAASMLSAQISNERGEP